MINCANSAAEDSRGIKVNGGLFKNHVPGKESYGTEDEVAVGADKAVYIYDIEEEMTIKEAVNGHTGQDVVWYIVK